MPFLKDSNWLRVGRISSKTNIRFFAACSLQSCKKDKKQKATVKDTDNSEKQFHFELEILC